tara:strand:- start:1473 stop:1844 length:372 start_codon:yes stop_codon:yes gene_type:complete
MSKEIYENIQRELDKNRVDEWHSVIPLSEDGSCLLDDLAEVSNPELIEGVNGLALHDTMRIQPKNSYTTTAYSLLFEDVDYIYNILTVESGDQHAGHLAQITRHDKQKHVVTREEWENSYTCG